jgi:acyl carrier protein
VNDNDDRLMRCFALVFPTATPEEIRTAQFDTIPGWDSLRGVTLLSVLDEEFGIQLDLSELLEMGTFAAVKGYVPQQK